MFFRRRRRDEDFGKEIEAHLAAETDRLIDDGMNPQDARWEAVRRFGNPTATRERFYESRRVLWWDHLRQDLEYAFRTMRRKPAFTGVIVLTLAVGIGANTAIFSIVNSVLLRPLPYQDPARLVVLWAEIRQMPGEKVFASYSDFKELKENSRSFADLAAITWANAGQTLIWQHQPHRVLAIPSTDNLFSLLGASALYGRIFNSEDLQRGCTVIVSHSFWRNHLGAAPDIINKNLTLDGRNCAVVGVMGEGFAFFPKQTDLWTLIPPDSRIVTDPNSSVAIFARLKHGVTRAGAQAEVAALHAAIARAAPAGSWLRDSLPVVYDLQGEFTFLAGPNLRLALLMLFAAVAIVLLIACVNVAGLLLSAGAERRRELALRAALGCVRSRIIRQLLTECMILSIFGGAGGVLLAGAGVRYFRIVNPINLPPGNPVSLNAHVLLFTAVIAIVTGLLFGLLPSVRVSRIDLNEVLKGTGSRFSQNWLNSKGGKLLIIAEVGLSMILLIGAGLLIESIYRLTAAPLSFKPDHLWTAGITLPTGAYQTISERSRFYDALLADVSAVPGVEGVALSSNKPLAGQNGNTITIAGRTGPTSEVGDVGAEQISADFITVMGIPLLRGRHFDPHDQDQSPRVAIVNSSLVAEYFPSEDPIGKQVKLGLPDSANPWLTIVGVVGNVERGDFFKEMGYRYAPIVYQPVNQISRDTMSLIFRSDNRQAGLTAALQKAVETLDSRVPVYDVSTVEDLVATNFSQPRFRTFLLAVFAGLALLLAAIGLYGVLTQTVIQLTRDIGIRMALGATRQNILGMVIRQGLTLTTIGIAAGVAASLYSTRWLGSMLYGVKSTNIFTFATTAAVLVAVTLVAIYIPARRATKVNPTIALRQE